LADLPALNTYELGDHEGDGRWHAGFLPRVVYSTAESWESEVRRLTALVHRAAEPTEGLRQRALELTTNEASPWGRIQALQLFVAQAIDTVDFPLHRLGFLPVAAEQVLSRSYGSQLDKAALLLALLRALAVEGHVVLVSDDSAIAAAVPWPGQFAQVWVAVDAAGQQRWLSVNKPLVLSTEQLPGHWYQLTLGQPGNPTARPPAAPETSAARVTATLRLHGQGQLSGPVHASWSGLHNPYFAIRANEQGSSAAARRLDAALGPDLALDGPGQVTQFGADGTSVAGEVKTVVEPEGETLWSLELPWVGSALQRPVDLRPSRQTPLVLPGPQVQSMEVSISLPSSWRVVGLPSTLDLRTNAGRLVQEVTVTGQLVEIRRELSLSLRVVEPGSSYEQTRQLLMEALRLDQEVLMVAQGS
jgi:hypothetical protein